jgi:hypothetical protein
VDDWDVELGCESSSYRRFAGTARPMTAIRSSLPGFLPTQAWRAGTVVDFDTLLA